MTYGIYDDTVRRRKGGQMATEHLDPTAQAANIWENAYEILKRNGSLTSRHKGWLEGVVPEITFDSTIVLRVDSVETQQALQSELNQPILQALTIVTGKDMFPAYKVMPNIDKKTENVSSNHVGPTAHQAQQAQPTATNRTPIVPDEAADTTESFIDRAEQHESQHADTPQHGDATATQGRLPISVAAPTQPTQNQEFSPKNSRQHRDPETHLNKQATFDTFVPGDSNRFARTVALAVAEGSGRDYNPLCIYGGSGLGKTHLLNAIGNYALMKDKDSKLKVRYVTSEEFTNEFIDALQNPSQSQGQIADFNRRYREVDVLLIDDIQFLGGKEATLEQFFHTFNSLQMAGKRIVIASDVAPKNLKGFEARLISRFESGLTVDVKPPDLETRIAILRLRASMNHTSIANDVLDLIAERCTENIRELEGALTRISAVASLSNQPVTKALAEQTLQDFFTSDIEIRPVDIISQVAQYFHLSFDDIVGRSRRQNVVLARQIAMYLARETTSMSLFDIGQVFGGRDHTTVMHGCTRISDEMGEQQEIYEYVMELTTRLKQHASEQ